MIIELKFNIKREIKQRGLTVAEVCSRLKSDRMYISRITEEVKLNKVIRIANAIGCSPSDLITGL